jgi:signal transduction histidine kinase
MTEAVAKDSSTMTVLRDLIVANRQHIIDHARRYEGRLLVVNEDQGNSDTGIPSFLTQLVDVLGGSAPEEPTVGPESTRRIAASAGPYGRAVLKSGFPVAQVVHDYGAVCQVITDLADSAGATISAGEFQTFNRCLDEAIAAAVTSYGDQREHEAAFSAAERLGMLAHELRNLVHTATLSFDMIKRGVVGTGGSTAAVHSRSLAGLRTLVARSLVEVRLDAAVPSFERLSVAELMDEVHAGAAMQAGEQKLALTMRPIDRDVVVDGDRHLLTSAMSNLIQNALKFTRSAGEVTLSTRTTADHVFLDVRDQCGGLPPGKAEELFKPFVRRSANETGLGLGLAIARRAVEANSGELSVKDLPGDGCIFTVALPRAGQVDHRELRSPKARSGKEQNHAIDHQKYGRDRHLGQLGESERGDKEPA